mmetsp:Transcript_7091/g.11943  ORF Transcript_7091/g.11943 Transcript_7091/m.11943 type:complete len:95 (+) Transcript_7091:25-309(+)
MKNKATQSLAVLALLSKVTVAQLDQLNVCGEDLIKEEVEEMPEYWNEIGGCDDFFDGCNFCFMGPPVEDAEDMDEDEGMDEYYPEEDFTPTHSG